MESFVNDHFRELSGKLFHFSGTLIMALEKDMPTQLKYISYTPPNLANTSYPYRFNCLKQTFSELA